MAAADADSPEGGRVAVDVIRAETGADAETSCRGSFVRNLFAGGAVLVGGVLIAGLPKLAVSAPSGAQDVQILNFALLLEYLQARFYDEAADTGILDGELRDFVEVVRGHEQAHVDYLTDALGDEAREEPTFSFGNSLQDPESFSAAAVALEDLGVAAYNGQAANLTRRRLADAATIVSVDARHAAWIRSIVGRTPARQPTDAPLTRRQVQAMIQELGFLEES